MHSPLTDKEPASPDGFLADPVHEVTTMDVSTLEGFLAAPGTAPETVLPSQWLPWVWDLHEGKANRSARWAAVRPDADEAGLMNRQE